MSIVLQGSTSGSVTLQEPAVAGTTVLTLPATSGTLITTASSGQSIPKAALPTGSVLQVVSANIVGGGSTTSTSFVNTNLTASITPLYSSSKILIIFTQFMGLQNGGGQTRIDFNLRLTGAATSDLMGYYYYGHYGTVPGESQTVISGSYLYSPSSTSSHTFTTQVRKAAGSAAECGTINYGSYAASSNNNITLMEIAA